MWSLVIVAILETVDFEVIENEKKAARAAKKKLEASTLLADEKKTDDTTESETISSPQKLISNADQKEKCLKKIVEMHKDWLVDVFNDANLCSSPVRQKHIIDTVIHKKKNKSALLNAFNENVWPALKSRGWTVEETEQNEDERLPYKIIYRFKGGRPVSLSFP